MILSTSNRRGAAHSYRAVRVRDRAAPILQPFTGRAAPSAVAGVVGAGAVASLGRAAPGGEEGVVWLLVGALVVAVVRIVAARRVFVGVLIVDDRARVAAAAARIYSVPDELQQLLVVDALVAVGVRPLEQRAGLVVAQPALSQRLDAAEPLRPREVPGVVGVELVEQGARGLAGVVAAVGLGLPVVPELAHAAVGAGAIARRAVGGARVGRAPAGERRWRRPLGLAGEDARRARRR